MSKGRMRGRSTCSDSIHPHPPLRGDLSQAWEYQIRVPASVSQCCAKCGGFGGTPPEEALLFSTRTIALRGDTPRSPPRLGEGMHAKHVPVTYSHR